LRDGRLVGRSSLGHLSLKLGALCRVLCLSGATHVIELFGESCAGALDLVLEGDTGGVELVGERCSCRGNLFFEGFARTRLEVLELGTTTLFFGRPLLLTASEVRLDSVALLLEFGGEGRTGVANVVIELGAARRVVALERGARLLGLSSQRSGGLACFGHLAVGDNPQFGELALSLGTQCRSLALCRRACLGCLGGDGASDGGRLARRFVDDGVGLGAGPGYGLFGIVHGGVGKLGRPLGGFGDHALGALGRLSLQALSLRLRGGTQLLGVDVGLADESCRLLFGNAQRLLELGAQAAVGGAAHLVEFCLQVVDDRLQPPDLFRRVGAVGVRLDELSTNLLQCAVDLFALVAAHL